MVLKKGAGHILSKLLKNWSRLMGRVTTNELEAARYYLSLLDSAEASSRAELARHPGVIRAGVTQVLRRLANPKSQSRKKTG